MLLFLTEKWIKEHLEKVSIVQAHILHSFNISKGFRLPSKYCEMLHKKALPFLTPIIVIILLQDNYRRGLS